MFIASKHLRGSEAGERIDDSKMAKNKKGDAHHGEWQGHAMLDTALALPGSARISFSR